MITTISKTHASPPPSIP